MFSAIASIAGPLIGASMMSGATSDAANTQAQATNNATAATADAQKASTAELARQYDTGRADLAPYRAAGTSALTRLRSLMGLSGPLVQKDANGVPIANQELYASDPNYKAAWDATLATHNAAYPTAGGYGTGSDANWIQNQIQNSGGAPDAGSLNSKFSINDFWNDPVVQASYQSGLDLGTKALKNAAPLTTGLDSGAAMKELTKFGTDYTGNMAAGSQSRFVGDQSNTFSKLMALVNGGQGATSTTVNAGANAAGNIASTNMGAASNISGLISGQGNAAGAARIAGANSWSGALSGISNWWNQNQMLDKVLNRGGVGAGTSGYGYNGAAPYSNYFAQD